MSKFKVQTSSFEKTSLSTKQIEYLFCVLKLNLAKLNDIVNKTIQELHATEKKYRVITSHKDFVIVIRESFNPKTSFCLGYPFPITHRILHNVKHVGFDVSFFLRGPLLRNAQKERFVSTISKKYSVQTHYITSNQTYRKLLKQVCIKFDTSHLFFVDFYRFLGDSFLGTYMLDAFKKEFGAKNTTIFSRSHKHLNGFYNAKDLSEWESVPENGLYVLSDLLDIDNAWIHNNFCKDGLYIINSRNWFIEKQNNDVNIYILKNKDDVILSSCNVFKYMQHCVSPFTTTKILKIPNKIKKLPVNRIYINPFSSLQEKSLTKEELCNLIHFLKRSYPEIKILIPSGHDNATKSFSKDIVKHTGVGCLSDNGIHDLYTKLADTDLVISTDTALTHIATKYSIRNIVLFKPGFWDSESLQSIFAESPLAFCSMSPYQLPLICSSTTDRVFMQISDIIDSMQGKNKYHCHTTPDFRSANFSYVKNTYIRWLQKRLFSEYKLKKYQ